MTGCLWPCVSGTNAKTAGSGGLFRSKPKSPTELVQHMGELLRFLAEHPEPIGGKSDGRREQKVIHLFMYVSFFFRKTYLIAQH
jgi:calcium binding protein 39